MASVILTGNCSTTICMSVDLDYKRRRDLALAKHPSMQIRQHGNPTDIKCIAVVLRILAEARRDREMLEYALVRIGRSRQFITGGLGSNEDISCSQAPPKASRGVTESQRGWKSQRVRDGQRQECKSLVLKYCSVYSNQIYIYLETPMRPIRRCEVFLLHRSFAFVESPF